MAAADQKPYTIRWGILATGGIAQTFTKDLLRDPSTRGVSDISHTVVAAASSSSATRASQFLDDCGVPANTAKAYGSYAELAGDADVQIVYVATPHSHHYQNARLCLEAGKHVLCEKAFTVNAAQAEILVKIAREKQLFLMEAVWTRFFPLARELRETVRGGGVGDVKRVYADLSVGSDVESVFGTKHRMVNLDLAGGALLDLGIYSLTWVFQFLYHTLPTAERKPPAVLSTMTKYDKTGADELTTVVLTFPPHGTQGIATTSLRVGSEPSIGGVEAGPYVRIQGTKGEIQVFGAARPQKYRILRKPAENTPPATDGIIEKDIPGHGMFWEADECARCLRDGKLESDGLSWEESLVIMRVMDEVREQNDLKYPDKLESTEYPLDGF